jgi:hypothetical protein
MGSHHRYGAPRSSRTRRVLPVIVVVCDDTRTAVAYFKLLKHEVKERKTVHVYPAPHHGATCRDVIEFAQTKAPKPTEPDDRVFVLVDLDTNPNAANLRDEASTASVIMLISNPCFEVWTLAHLEDTGELFSDCKAVLSRVRAEWRELFGTEFGSKAQADYEKLMPLRESAIARCEARKSAANQSWTEVWCAVKVILQ